MDASIREEWSKYSATVWKRLCAALNSDELQEVIRCAKILGCVTDFSEIHNFFVESERKGCKSLRFRWTSEMMVDYGVSRGWKDAGCQVAESNPPKITQFFQRV